MPLSTNLEDNITLLNQKLPLNQSFDFLTRSLTLGNTKAYWIGINGLCKSEPIQRLFTNLQDPTFTSNSTIEDIQNYMNSKIGYSQAQLSDDLDTIITNILSGPTALFIDGFSQAIIIDVRSYPTRGIDEPDTEKVIRGSKDGFVETLVFNSALIRRRLRSNNLIFNIQTIGTVSKTDVAIAYLDDIVDKELLRTVKQKLTEINTTTLTMGAKSLEELLVKKRWCNPLPCFHMTERPDVACSYLTEGHILLMVDTSPTVIILPCTIFQFTQSPEDYYKSPSVGNYIRIIRFACLLVSLLLMPVFLLLGMYADVLPDSFNVLTADPIGPIKLFVYVVFIELGLDLFKYSSSHATSGFSQSLSIVGGLVISDIAINLQWASTEVIFYGAATMLATLSLANIEFAEGIRLYRIFLVLCTGFFKLPGFIIGLSLIILSIITTPTFANKSYFWPLYPFNWKALRTLLFRYPTSKAQPTTIYKQK